MQWENEQKKNYLRQYIVLSRKEQELEEEIEALRQRYIGRAITYSNTPKGSGNGSDLSDYAAQVDGLLDKLMRRQREAVQAYREIEEKIEQLGDEREKEVLRLRYLRNLPWEEIAKAIGYELTNTYHIHGLALQHFPLILKSS